VYRSVLLRLLPTFCGFAKRGRLSVNINKVREHPINREFSLTSKNALRKTAVSYNFSQVRNDVSLFQQSENLSSFVLEKRFQVQKSQGPAKSPFVNAFSSLKESKIVPLYWAARINLRLSSKECLSAFSVDRYPFSRSEQISAKEITS
jgi:hypothetical protein